MTENPHNHFLVAEALARVPENPRSAVNIVLAPVEISTSYSKGTASGPQEIIHASHQIEDYDIELEYAPCALHKITTDQSLVSPIMKCNASGKLDEVVSLIQQKTVEILKADEIPLFLGGEHTVSYGVLRGYREFTDKPLTVVQMDAHGDLRAAYDGRDICHASVFYHVSQFYPVRQFGIRVTCEEELEFLAKPNCPVKCFSMPKLNRNPNWMQELIASIPTEAVYLSVDVDGFDPSIMPATGTPVPGGLSWDQGLEFFKLLMQKKKVIGADFVELSPQPGLHHASFLTAMLIYRLIGLGFSSIKSL